MSEHVNDIDYHNKPNNNGKAVIGMVLLIIGGLLLLRQFSFFFDTGLDMGMANLAHCGRALYRRQT